MYRHQSPKYSKAHRRNSLNDLMIQLRINECSNIFSDCCHPKLKHFCSSISRQPKYKYSWSIKHIFLFQHFRLQVLSLFFVLKSSIRSTNCTYLDSLDLVDSFFTFLSPLLFQLTHMCLLKNFCQKQREKVFPKCTVSCLEMRCIRCMLRTILQTKQRKKRLNS